MPPNDPSGSADQNNDQKSTNAPVEASLNSQTTPDGGATAPESTTGSPALSPVQPAPDGGKNKKVALVAVAVVLLAVAGAGLWWWNAQRNTPDKVFTSALSKLLSTKTITQSATQEGATGTVAYDIADIKNPKLSVAFTQKDSGMTIRMSGYGTLQNDYVKYTSFGSAMVDNALDGMVDKWVQLRVDGKMADGVDADMVSLADPRYMLFGDLIMGNFSASDRQKFLNYIAANKVYNYDPKKVVTETVHGKTVYVYSMTENVPKLKELNKQAAKLSGIQVADIQPALDDLGKIGTTKVYIDVSTKEIVQYTTTDDGVAVSGSYTEYDTTSLPQEPKADLSWAQFQQKQADISSLFGGDTTDNTTPATTTQQI